MSKTKTPLRAIREHCLDCSGTAKTVAWCPCDGLHSTWCPLWPYRFGLRPKTAAQRYGRHAVTPRQMPAASTDLGHLPANPADWEPDQQGRS